MRAAGRAAGRSPTAWRGHRTSRRASSSAGALLSIASSVTAIPNALRRRVASVGIMHPVDDVTQAPASGPIGRVVTEGQPARVDQGRRRRRPPRLALRRGARGANKLAPCRLSAQLRCHTDGPPLEPSKNSTDRRQVGRSTVKVAGRRRSRDVLIQPSGCGPSLQRPAKSLGPSGFDASAIFASVANSASESRTRGLSSRWKATRRFARSHSAVLILDLLPLASVLTRSLPSLPVRVRNRCPMVSPKDTGGF